MEDQCDTTGTDMKGPALALRADSIILNYIHNVFN